MADHAVMERLDRPLVGGCARGSGGSGSARRGCPRARLPAPRAAGRRFACIRCIIDRGSSWRYVAAAEISLDWERRSGQAGYFVAPVVIAWRYRGVAFQADEPGDPGYPSDQVELFSEVHLRGALGLTDGDTVAVRVRDL